MSSRIPVCFWNVPSCSSIMAHSYKFPSCVALLRFSSPNNISQKAQKSTPFQIKSKSDTRTRPIKGTMDFIENVMEEKILDRRERQEENVYEEREYERDYEDRREFAREERFDEGERLRELRREERFENEEDLREVRREEDRLRREERLRSERIEDDYY
jgi:hypothetical protein